VAESPSDDMQALVDLLLPTAQGLVDENGAFAPFGGVVTASGDSQVVMPVSDAEVDMEAARDGLYSELRRWAGEGRIRAAAVCLDVALREPVETDAICVHVEHADAEGLRVIAPYAQEGAQPAVFGEPLLDPAEREIFVPGQPSS
jgi:hypothetical protein